MIAPDKVFLRRGQGGIGIDAFDPLSLSPSIYVHADSLRGSKNDGDTVATWPALAGGSPTAFVSKQPLFKVDVGGKVAVLFDGVDDWMGLVTPISAAGNFTMFAKMHRSAGATMVAFGNTTSLIPIGLMQFGTDIFGSNTAGYNSGAANVSGWNSFVLTNTGGTLAIRANGAPVTTSFSVFTGAAEFNAIGVRNSNFGAGSIRCAGIIPSVVSGANLASLESWLAAQ